MVTLNYTQLEQIPKIASQARANFDSGRTRPVAYRKQQLKRLHAFLKQNEEALVEAMVSDFKAKNDAILEVRCCVNALIHTLDELDNWIKPSKVKRDIAFIADSAYVKPEPLGAILIIAPWNYPLMLCVEPLICAISAGCTAVVKPSEVSAHTTALFTDLLPKYLDDQCYRIVNGAVAETTELLNQKWDHIFYTGNGTVGRIVMQAAAKNLTPVTLELGGKSPVWVDKTSDLTVAANRICFGKFMNAGQTCIAPDYVLCESSVRDRLVEELDGAIKRQFGDDPHKSTDYARLMNSRHFERVKKLTEGSANFGDGKSNVKVSGKVALGGKFDSSTRYMSPTVVVDPAAESPLMQEEIFGPVLPIITMPNADAAISFINSRDKPLAMYVFTRDKAVFSKFSERTSSGAITLNDCVMQFMVCDLPFGGVGPSGMGAYHGRKGFEGFSHLKPVLERSQSLEFVNTTLRYAPLTPARFDAACRLLFRDRDVNKARWLGKIIAALKGIAIVLAALFLAKQFKP